MEKEKMSLLFKSKFKCFEKLNDNFLKAKCYVLALGKNINRSHFSKENVDRAYSSLFYVPVVGHLMCDENGNHYLGGHDVKLDLETLTIKSVCVPFGVAIPSEEPVYEDVTEEDGTVSTYLVSDVILWIGRYPELAEAIYDESTYFGQSMEILYSKSEPLKDDNKYTDIIDFSFDALCLLNKSDDPKFNIQPCFPSASVKPLNYSIDKDEFSQLMEEMKSQLNFCLNKNDTEQGGKILEEKNAILQKYGKSVEDLDFSIDDLSIEEFEKKMDELFGETNESVAFSATYNQKRKALSNALDPIIVKDAEGNYVEETHFYVSDFDDEYVYVEVDHWNATGDYTCKYGRKSYTFDETTLTATISDEFEEMVKVWLTLNEKEKLDTDRANYESISTEFDAYKSEHSYTNSEYETLKEFEEKVNKEKRKADENSVFAEYENEIGDTPEFSELKEKASEFSIEELKKECLCIVGLYARANKSNETKVEKPKEIKFSVETPSGDDENEKPYGGLMEKYLNK